MINLINYDPQYWRDLAQQKREMAERMHTADARASFMNAAEHYEQMARQVEALTDAPDEPDSVGG
jgi:putative heme iron utilization protein